MNRFSTAKLHLSKWTAVQPVNREKHFLVTRVLRDADDRVDGCVIEAVHSGRETRIDPRELRDDSRWLMGWQ